MKKVNEIKRIIKAHRRELREKFNVRKIAIFGSYARGEETPESDIDILVEFEKPVGFLFFHLEEYLSELLGVKVDLVTRDAIKKNRLKYIDKDILYV